MRKCLLGHKPTEKSWSPAYTLPKRTESKPKVDKYGRPTKMVATYWPRLKGGFSMELLRRYWHVKMPHLLDVWPHVVTWTSKVETVAYANEGRQCEFTPSFRVTESGGCYALYLYDDRKKAASEASLVARATRHEFLSALFLARKERLLFMSRTEVESHPHLPAAQEIFYHRYWEWPAELPREIAVICSRENIPTLGDLLLRLGGGDFVWRQILSLIANGHIEIDLDAGLGDATPISTCRIQGFV
jgi:hypothetical protein